MLEATLDTLRTIPGYHSSMGNSIYSSSYHDFNAQSKLPPIAAGGSYPRTTTQSTYSQTGMMVASALDVLSELPAPAKVKGAFTPAAVPCEVVRCHAAHVRCRAAPRRCRSKPCGAALHLDATRRIHDMYINLYIATSH